MRTIKDIFIILYNTGYILITRGWIDTGAVKVALHQTLRHYRLLSGQKNRQTLNTIIIVLLFLLIMGMIGNSELHTLQELSKGIENRESVWRW